MTEEWGTAEERSAVRHALIALKEFNSKVEICRGLGILCELNPVGWTFAADFTKTITILPALLEPPTGKSDRE